MSEFLKSVGNNYERYVAFLISFLVIAAAWRRYHSVFRYIERVDAQVRNYNVLWLLMIILNPFATRLLTTPGQDYRWSAHVAVRVLRPAAGAVFGSVAADGAPCGRT